MDTDWSFFMPDNYTVVETVPTAEAFCRLREISGLSPRPLEADPESTAWQLLRHAYSV